jgi:hypothetical protein
MIFSENRYPLFRIMLGKQKGSGTPAGACLNVPHQRMRRARYRSALA